MFCKDHWKNHVKNVLNWTRTIKNFGNSKLYGLNDSQGSDQSKMFLQFYANDRHDVYGEIFLNST